MIARCINTYSYIVYRKGIYKKMKSIFKKTLCSIMLFCLLFLCVGVVTKVSAADDNTYDLVYELNSATAGLTTSTSYAPVSKEVAYNDSKVQWNINLCNYNSKTKAIRLGSNSKQKAKLTLGTDFAKLGTPLGISSDTTYISAISESTLLKKVSKISFSFSKVNNAAVEAYLVSSEDGESYKQIGEAKSLSSSPLTWEFNEKENAMYGFVFKYTDYMQIDTPVISFYKNANQTEKTDVEKFQELPTSASLNISYDKTVASSTVNYYTKVTEALDDYSGKYLIVYEGTDDLKVFNGVDKENGYVSAEKNENNVLVETDELSACKVIVDAIKGGYSIQISSGDNNSKYMTSASKNGITFSDSAVLNTIEITNGVATIISNSKTIKFNSASDQMRFRYYGSGQKDVVLYKLSEDPMTVEKEDFTFGNASLRFGLVELPVSDYEKMIAEGATFGIALTKGNSIDIETAKKVECTPVRVNKAGKEDANGEYYQFAVVINDIAEENFASEVTAVAYVKIGDEYHTVKESKTFSIKTLAAQYVSLYEASPEKYSELEQHINALKALAK